MRVTRVFPGPPETVEADVASGRDRLLELYEATPGSLRLNMVADISGSAAGPDGTSETLTSRTDRTILGVIRELSDVVVVGAASVRAEGYLLPRRSRLAVITASGDLSGHRLSAEGSHSVIVLCPAAASARVRETLPKADITVVAGSHTTLRMVDAIAALRSTGLSSIVCEGGPSLAGQLLGADLVDEVCLTTSPQLSGHPLALFYGVTVHRELLLSQLLIDDSGFLFARWSTRVTQASD